jgi:hypothetical protein
MNPAFGLGELNKNQLGANGTYFTAGLTFRMRSIAALASTFREYMRYAAAIVALRPGLHNKSRPRIVKYMRGPRTRSGLAVDENAPTLIDFSLYECYRGDQMLKHVSFLHIVQGDLVSDDGLRSPEH